MSHAQKTKAELLRDSPVFALGLPRSTENMAVIAQVDVWLDRVCSFPWVQDRVLSIRPMQESLALWLPREALKTPPRAR